jgi:hypothetical protein
VLRDAIETEVDGVLACPLYGGALVTNGGGNVSEQLKQWPLGEDNRHLGWVSTFVGHNQPSEASLGLNAHLRAPQGG